MMNKNCESNLQPFLMRFSEKVEQCTSTPVRYSKSKKPHGGISERLLG